MRFGEEIRVVGNVAALGHWDPNKAAAMQWIDGHVWVTTVELEFPPASSGKSLEYKYVLMSDGEVNKWESCENRRLCLVEKCSSLVCHNIWDDLNSVTSS